MVVLWISFLLMSTATTSATTLTATSASAWWRSTTTVALHFLGAAFILLSFFFSLLETAKRITIDTSSTRHRLCSLKSKSVKPPPLDASHPKHKKCSNHTDWANQATPQKKAYLIRPLFFFFFWTIFHLPEKNILISPYIFMLLGTKTL